MITSVYLYSCTNGFVCFQLIKIKNTSRNSFNKKFSLQIFNHTFTILLLTHQFSLKNKLSHQKTNMTLTIYIIDIKMINSYPTYLKLYPSTFISKR